MKLSICIPTYNRAECLNKTLRIYASQIESNQLYNDVEINISDNGSLDNTKDVVEKFVSDHRRIKITYIRNDTNLGPDKNYIQAMNMAKGEYSILWSDDDYLKENALIFIIGKIMKNPDVHLFLSNRTEWYDGSVFICERKFLHEGIPTRIFDFNDRNQLLLYLSSVISFGGMLSFISSVVYKTGMIHHYEYDGCLDGSYYAFWFYWWQDLFEGNKLMYLNKSYTDCTLAVTNDNFGKGVDRALVDFNGLLRISKVIKMDEEIKSYFFMILKHEHPLDELLEYKILNSEEFESRIVPKMKLCDFEQTCIEKIRMYSSKKRILRNFIIAYFPFIYKLYNRNS